MRTAPGFWSMSWFPLAAIVVLAGCASQPVQPPPCQCAPPKPAAESAFYMEMPFEALPGWGASPLGPSLRAFVAGCPRPGALARACTAARAVDANDDAAARRFFESTFVPYALVS